MSQRTLPNSKNPRRQRQEQVETHQEVGNGFPHAHNQPRIIPFGSNFEVAELTWENGQLSMNGFGRLLNSGPKKPWDTTNETLESIVQQATYHKHNHNLYQGEPQPTPLNKNSVTASSNGGVPETSSGICACSVPLATEKRALSNFNQCAKNFNGCNYEQFVDHSACASANVTFDSLPSLRTKTTYEDSAYRCIADNQCEDRETKTELAAPSLSSRKSRAAAVHNLSERKRRDRINQKLRTLQKLVPNACKTDKASMLDEVINYLKQLQTQVQLMSMRNITPPHMMVPIGMQQHLQKSLLMARMEMGMPGMSSSGHAMPESFSPFFHFMANSPLVATTTVPTFLPHFVLPTLVPPIGPTRCSQELGANHSVPLADPYCSFHAQSMNVDLYNKMVGLQQQRIDQLTKAAGHPSQSNGFPK